MNQVHIFIEGDANCLKESWLGRAFHFCIPGWECQSSGRIEVYFIYLHVGQWWQRVSDSLWLCALSCPLPGRVRTSFRSWAIFAGRGLSLR